METSVLSLTPRINDCRTIISAPRSLGATGPKLKESSRPFSYALMDEVVPVLRLIWPGAMSPTGKLAGSFFAVSKSIERRGEEGIRQERRYVGR